MNKKKYIKMIIYTLFITIAFSATIFFVNADSKSIERIKKSGIVNYVKNTVSGSNHEAIIQEGKIALQSQNYKRASEIFIEGCDKHNHDQSCYNTALFYLKGIHFTQSYHKAFEYYRKSCELDYPIGCFNLGVMYHKGEGIPIDYKKAKKLYTKACDSENADACSNLGQLYEHGKGTSINYHKASDYYEKACQLKSGQACLNKAVLYFNAKGVNKDFNKAALYLKKSCDLGHQGACTSYQMMGNNY
jgi:uncharacterized protein